jgi:serine/threonine protein kinase
MPEGISSGVRACLSNIQDQRTREWVWDGKSVVYIFHCPEWNQMIRLPLHEIKWYQVVKNSSFTTWPVIQWIVALYPVWPKTGITKIYLDRTLRRYYQQFRSIEERMHVEGEPDQPLVRGWGDPPIVVQVPVRLWCICECQTKNVRKRRDNYLFFKRYTTTLRQYVDANILLDDAETKCIMWQVLQGIRYLHSLDIAHCGLHLLS